LEILDFIHRLCVHRDPDEGVQRVQGLGFRVKGCMGVLEQLHFLFSRFEWTYPPYFQLLRFQRGNYFVLEVFSFVDIGGLTFGLFG
jgi:hypothetical protein